MKYLEITIKLNRCAIEPVLAALDMIGIDDAEVRDPHDAEEILADKETYEWDYVDAKVAADLGKTPEIHIYHEVGGASDKDADQNPAAVFADPALAGAADQGQASDDEFVESVKNAVAQVKKGFDDGAFGEGQDPGELEVLAEVKDDSLWKDKWKEFFRPTHISGRIVVKPTWEVYEPADGEIVIEIDPGMAFGTGTHETTSMCMKALEKYVKPGMSVLDAGCGSGILSIAAAKLGASDVLGVDIDEEAVRVSDENFELNGTADVCKAMFGDVTKGIEYPGAAAGENADGGDTEGAAGVEAGAAADGEPVDAGGVKNRYMADIVAANLMAELLCLVSQGLADHLKKGGTLISSGILNEKEEMVKAAFENAGLRITEVMHDGEWCCVMAEK